MGNRFQLFIQLIWIHTQLNQSQRFGLKAQLSIRSNNDFQEGAAELIPLLKHAGDQQAMACTPALNFDGISGPFSLVGDIQRHPMTQCIHHALFLQV